MITIDSSGGLWGFAHGASRTLALGAAAMQVVMTGFFISIPAHSSPQNPEWRSDQAGCEGTAIELGKGQYQLVSTATRYLEVSGASVQVSPASQDADPSTPLGRRLVIEGLTGTKAGDAAVAVPTSCQQAQTLLTVDATNTSLVVVSVGGVQVSGTKGNIEVPFIIDSVGPLAISTTTGTIRVIKPDEVRVEAATSAQLVSDFSISITHLDGQEPSKSALVTASVTSHDEPALLWSLRSLQGDVFILHRSSSSEVSSSPVP